MLSILAARLILSGFHPRHNLHHRPLIPYQVNVNPRSTPLINVGLKLSLPLSEVELLRFRAGHTSPVSSPAFKPLFYMIKNLLCLFFSVIGFCRVDLPFSLKSRSFCFVHVFRVIFWILIWILRRKLVWYLVYCQFC